ncbi:MAG: hypothetical protein ACI9NN_000191 [Bacteroidia bacterium]
MSKISKNTLGLTPYLFADAGVLAMDRDHNSGLRVDAGLGFLLSIRFNKFSSTKPLNLRLDLPFFLNRIPEDQENYLAMRYVVGINRAF